MSKQLQIEMERLQRMILEMAGCVEEAVYASTSALEKRDAVAARRVLEKDHEIDLFENAVQEECLKILALHQPVAVDLRRISAVMLISTDLERMGDLAVNIAERAIAISQPPFPTIPQRLTSMTHRATQMVHKALGAFVNSDANAAREIIRLDTEVDRDNDAIIAELIAEMKLSPDRIESGISLFSAVRHLERIADHATNIAEDVVYLVEGSMLRHSGG